MSSCSTQKRTPPVSVLRHGSFGLSLILALASTVLGQTPEQQSLPWQIGSSALAGKQANPVIFLSPEQTTIPANKPAVIDLHFRIAEGLHINSHKPQDASLIPTQIVFVDPAGINTTAVDFPAGTDTAFAFAPDQKLNVYTGELIVHAHITARHGNRLWQGFMRYQACNNSQCLPPKKVPVAVDIIAQ